MTQRKPKSPWQRHQKVHYQYSEAFQAWDAAARVGDRSAMRHHGARQTAHCAREYGPMPGPWGYPYDRDGNLQHQELI